MQWEKVELAARMQNYIRDHCMDADFTMDALYEAAGYSRRPAVFLRSLWIKHRKNMSGRYR